jgi:cytochrome c5
MAVFIRAAALLLCASLAGGVAHATPAAPGDRAGLQAAPPATPATEGSGQQILTRKCFQCHQPTMWTSVRQDRKAWEAVLYRMVGRGALWTEAEINAMATFLADTRGPAK